MPCIAQRIRRQVSPTVGHGQAHDCEQELAPTVGFVRQAIEHVEHNVRAFV